MKLVILFIFVSSFSYSQSKQDQLYDLSVEMGMSYYKHYQTDSLKQMMSSFQSAINMKPNAPYAYYIRGYIKQELGDFRGAMKDLNVCIQSDPNYIDCYEQRARLKSNFKDWRGAAADFEKVLKLIEKQNIDYDGVLKYEHILYNIGSCKINSGEIEEACNYYSKAGELGYFQAYEAIKKYCN